MPVVMRGERIVTVCLGNEPIVDLASVAPERTMDEQTKIAAFCDGVITPFCIQNCTPYKLLRRSCNARVHGLSSIHNAIKAAVIYPQKVNNRTTPDLHNMPWEKILLEY